MNLPLLRRFVSTSIDAHRRRRSREWSASSVLESLESRTLLAGAISGVVTTGGSGYGDALVSLYEADSNGTTMIGQDQADEFGHFDVSYPDADRGSFLYLVASDGPVSSSDVVLMSIAGEVGGNLNHDVTINEFTTVGTVNALAQFLNGTDISGPSPGLNNAVATAFTLYDPTTGTPAELVSNENNGTTLIENPTSTQALAKMNSLANMVAAVATDSTGLTADLFFSLTTPTGGMTPTNTAEALHNISQNATTLDNIKLDELSKLNTTYGPTLTEIPSDWIVALHLTEGGFNAPGRMAFDAQGNMWTNNNFLYIEGVYGPGELPSLPGRQISVLNPAGEPILGSPIYALGVNGSGYGTAIAPDGSIWISNFDEGGITKFYPNGRKAFFVPGLLSGLDHPMGMAFDQDGNLWIANMGDPADSSDPGSVTVYFKGNPWQRRTFTQDVYKPFSVAVDGQGRVWAANSPIAGGRGVVVMELKGRRVVKVQSVDSDALTKPIDNFPLRPYSDFASPRTIAIDSQGNAWVANFESSDVTFINGETFEVTDYLATKEPLAEPSRQWGLAVDGSDRIWIQSFSNPPIEGRLMDPPFISVVDGSEEGRGNVLANFSNKSLQHVTALQIDQSGNVWVANNWSLESTPGAITGGDGIVKFIGIATPVKTPLIGSPEAPTNHELPPVKHPRHPFYGPFLHRPKHDVPLFSSVGGLIQQNLVRAIEQIGVIGPVISKETIRRTQSTDVQSAIESIPSQLNETSQIVSKTTSSLTSKVSDLVSDRLGSSLFSPLLRRSGRALGPLRFFARR
ncbi:MAG: hypothetical protein R3B91_01365 [Planctomycetaceae bacterium]